MRSHVTKKFRSLFADLPSEIRQRARQSYLLWKENPAHPGVQFKRVRQRPPIYLVVAHTERSGRLRLVSARKMTRRERKAYEE